jgi:hypothetical protein
VFKINPTCLPRLEEKDFLSCGPEKIRLDAKLAAGNCQNLSHIEIDKAVSLRAAS